MEGKVNNNCTKESLKAVKSCNKSKMMKAAKASAVEKCKAKKMEKNI